MSYDGAECKTLGACVLMKNWIELYAVQFRGKYQSDSV